MKLYSNLVPHWLRVKIKQRVSYRKFQAVPVVPEAHAEYHIVSFPKCGRSWLALMLCDAVYRALPEVERIDDVSTRLLYRADDRLPSILFSHDDQPMLKTPTELVYDKYEWRGRKVVFLVRDPRDVIISWYFQCVDRGSLSEFNSSVKADSPSDFLYNERGGLKTLIAFYNAWYENRYYPRKFTLLKYEELREDSTNQLAKLMKNFNLNDLVSAAAIQEAVDANEFKRVQQREKQNAIKSATGHNVFGTVSNDGGENSLKARRGKIGGYKDYLTSDEIAYLNQYINSHLHPAFGYHENT